MKFLNNGEDIQIRMEYTNPGYVWRILRKGETMDLPKDVGLSYNLQAVALKSKIGKIKVETKILDDSFQKELEDINGIGKYTAEDIVSIYKKKEELLKNIKGKKSLPLRNDIEKKLREHYE